MADSHATTTMPAPATDAPTNVEIYKASTDAAALCKEIVIATALTIQKRKYVKVEGWQAIATAHGCVASSRDVEDIESGTKAIGEVHRMSDGQLISQAEGFVGKDEPTWYGGEIEYYDRDGVRRTKRLQKRADYAIRAMAQTRAISRACRSAFAYVVVMMNAGLQTTPAEEMGSDLGDPADDDANNTVKRRSGLMDKNVKQVVDQSANGNGKQTVREWFDEFQAECETADTVEEAEAILKREEVINSDRVFSKYPKTVTAINEVKQAMIKRIYQGSEPDWTPPVDDAPPNDPASHFVP